MVTHQHIADVLKDYRTNRSISQTALGELIGLRQKDISNMENCKTGIDSVQKICMVADKLNIPYEEIFENEDLYKIDIKGKTSELSKEGYKSEAVNDIQSFHQKEEGNDMYINYADLNNIASNCNKFVNYSKRGALILSENYKVLMQGQEGFEPGRNQNVLVLGSSGSGKGMHFIKPNLRKCFGNYVLSSPDDMSEVKQCMREHGYHIVEISLTEKKTNIYDPFRYIDMTRDISDIVKDVITFASIITTNESSLFWRDAEKTLLTSIMLVYLANEDSYYSESFHQFLNNIIKDTENLESIFEETSKAITTHNVSERYDIKTNLIIIASKNYYSCHCNKKTLNSVLLSLKMHLQMMGEIYINDERDLRTILYTPDTCVFVKLPTSYDGFSTRVSLILYQLLENGFIETHHESLRYIFDEFSNFDIPRIDEYMKISRRQGVSITNIIQSIHQLKAKEQEFIHYASDYIVYLGSPSLEDMKFISERAGSRKYRCTNNKGTEFIAPSEEVNIISIDEVRALPHDKCIIIHYGELGVIDNKTGGEDDVT